MPYISKEDRPQYQKLLTELSKIVPKDVTKRCGHMNYLISLLIEKVYGEKLRYYEYNEISGLLGCIKDEIYRRKTGPYEDEAIEKNGDLSEL